MELIVVRVEGTLESSLEGMKARVVGALEECGELVRYKAAQNAPKKSGRLSGSYYATSVVELQPGRSRIEVRSDHPAAFAHEWGSGTRSERGDKGFITILPVKGKVLAFKWPNAPAHLVNSQGFTVLPRVEHPGVPALHILTRALGESEPEIRKRIGAAIGARS